MAKKIRTPRLFCLICGVRVSYAVPAKFKAGPYDPPDNATVWTSHGNYGSTVYDPCDEWSAGLKSEHLEAVICDLCLDAVSARIQRRIYRLEQPYNVPSGRKVGRFKALKHNPKFKGKKTLIRIERFRCG